MPFVLPLIVPLVTSSAGDLRGALKWRTLPRATFVLLIRDPTNAKTLGTDGRYYDSLPQTAKRAVDTVFTKQRSIALAFLECPDARMVSRPSGVPNHLKLLREISGVLRVAMSLPRKGTVTD